MSKGFVICVDVYNYLVDTDSCDSSDDIMDAKVFRDTTEVCYELGEIIEDERMGRGVGRYTVVVVDAPITIARP